MFIKPYFQFKNTYNIKLNKLEVLAKLNKLEALVKLDKLEILTKLDKLEVLIKLDKLEALTELDKLEVSLPTLKVFQKLIKPTKPAVKCG